MHIKKTTKKRQLRERATRVALSTKPLRQRFKFSLLPLLPTLTPLPPLQLIIKPPWLLLLLLLRPIALRKPVLLSLLLQSPVFLQCFTLAPVLLCLLLYLTFPSQASEKHRVAVLLRSTWLESSAVARSPASYPCATRSWCSVFPAMKKVHLQ